MCACACVCVCVCACVCVCVCVHICACVVTEIDEVGQDHVHKITHCRLAQRKLTKQRYGYHDKVDADAHPIKIDKDSSKKDNLGWLRIHRVSPISPGGRGIKQSACVTHF